MPTVAWSEMRILLGDLGDEAVRVGAGEHHFGSVALKVRMPPSAFRSRISWTKASIEASTTWSEFASTSSFGVVDVLLREQDGARRALGQPVDRARPRRAQALDQGVGAVLLDVAAPAAARPGGRRSGSSRARGRSSAGPRRRSAAWDAGSRPRRSACPAGGRDDDVDPVGLADRAHDAVEVDVGRVVDRAEHAARRGRGGLADVGVLDRSHTPRAAGRAARTRSK